MPPGSCPGWAWSDGSGPGTGCGPVAGRAVPMRRVRRSAIVPYPAREMFALVSDVDAYPEFLPWCRSSTVHERTEALMVATLELSKGGMTRRFTTRNALVPHERITMMLVEGPFHHLEGIWRFEALDDDACDVELDMCFDFNDALKRILFGPVFEDIARSLVGAFSDRARAIHGRA